MNEKIRSTVSDKNNIKVMVIININVLIAKFENSKKTVKYVEGN